MHLADFVDVIAQRCHLSFFFRQHGPRLVQRPGEVVAVVLHRNVGVLRSIKSAVLTIAQPLVHPADDVLRDIREQLFTRSLVPVDIILEQFGVVVRHLFEVRHHPLLARPAAPRRSLDL